MKNTVTSILRKLLRDEAGQSVVVLAASITALLGLAGISIESGHAYLAYQQLIASTDSAALAGAQGLPDTTTATGYVNAYSAATVNGVAGKNASPLLTNVAVTPSFLCLNTVSTTLNVPCLTSNWTAGGSNTVQVKQTADVPSWFAGMFGIKTFHLSYTSTAAWAGGSAAPWNLAVILDSTGSMGNPDSGKQCSGTQESCALQGIQALLSDLYPCASGQSCAGSNVYFDTVSLYVFPPVLATTAEYDYCTGGSSQRGGGYSSPTTEYYEVPSLPSGTSGWTYKIVSFSNDYRTSDSATSLNTSSDLVKATGYSGTNCSGIQPGGYTFYAQVIYQAQSDLIAQQNEHPGSKNAMIILSDGDATAQASVCSSGTYLYSTRKNRNGQYEQYICSNSWLQPSANNALNGIPANNPTSYTYPSNVGTCGQAVVAAQAAANAGTAVYTIGYGSETMGCTYDKQYSATVSGGGGNWALGDTPCQALAAMASQPAYFYSDDANGCVATVPSNANLTQMTAIFHRITAGMKSPRLIPNGTT